MTSLSSLIDQLNQEIRMDRFNKLWDTTQKTQFLNQAYFQVQKDMGFKLRENQALYTINTVAGTREYALPSDFVLLKMVTYNGQPLEKTEYEDLKYRQIADVQGTPYEYYIYGTNIGLNPIPDSIKPAILYYRKRLPTLTSSQGTTPPSDFDLAIIKYAAYLLWSTPRGNRQTAQDKATDYKQSVDTLRLAYVYSDMNDLKFGIQRRAGNYFSTPKNLL